MDFSDNKVWLGHDAECQVSLYLRSGSTFREVLLDKSKIYYLTPHNEDRTIIVLTGGEEVMVSMPIDALNHMLRQPDLRQEKIDLLPYTGTNASKKLSDIFDNVVKGDGGSRDGSFTIKAFVHETCEQPYSAYLLREISSREVQFLQEGCDDREYKTYIHGPQLSGTNGCYVDIPCSLMRQFMAHAKARNAALLDLTQYSDPVLQTPHKKQDMRDVPQVYTSDVFTYKPL